MKMDKMNHYILHGIIRTRPECASPDSYDIEYKLIQYGGRDRLVVSMKKKQHTYGTLSGHLYPSEPRQEIVLPRYASSSVRNSDGQDHSGIQEQEQKQEENIDKVK